MKLPTLPLDYIKIDQAPKYLIGQKTELFDAAVSSIMENIRIGVLSPKLFSIDGQLIPLARNFVESEDFFQSLSTSNGWSLIPSSPDNHLIDITNLIVSETSSNMFGQNIKAYHRVHGDVCIKLDVLKKFKQNIAETLLIRTSELITIGTFDELSEEHQKWIELARNIVANLQGEKRKKYLRKNSGFNQTKIAEDVKDDLFYPGESETIRRVLNQYRGLWHP